MRKRSLGFILFFIAAIFCFSACGTDATTESTATEDTSASSESFYTISKNENLTYSYEIVDKNGNVLFAKNNAPKEPHIDEVSENIIGVTVQTGTGLSTNWAVFCDVEKGTVSETFHYVLGAQDEYVFYADFEDGVLSLVVQNIFNSSNRTVHPLQDCGAFADPIRNLTFDGEGKATITYLTGTAEAVTETSATIDYP